MHILKAANIPNSRDTGMGRVMHSTAEELRKLGHPVDFLFSEDVPRRASGRGDRFLFPIALVKTIKREMARSGAYDIVEIHEPSAACYCYARRKDPALPPCVIMSHGLEEPQWQMRLKLDAALGQRTSRKSRVLVPLTLLSLARYGLRHCQQIMCLNSADERYLRQDLQITPARISRIQNGVSDMFFTSRERSCENNQRLLFVGSWLEKKGRRFLSEAFVQLKERHPQLHLTLLGTGLPSEEVLKYFPERLAESITVHSRVNDKELLDAYTSNSIFCFPTYFEPWGLVLTEAAATGMAIVTTCAGGPADIFRDGEDALLVPLANVEALTDAIRRLIEDPCLRLSLGEKAQARAKQLTWRAAAESHLRAYERAITA